MSEFCDTHLLRRDERRERAELGIVVERSECVNCPYWIAESEALPEQPTLEEVIEA